MSAVSDYTGLITARHRSAPVFVATVAASVQGFVDIANFARGALAAAFDVDQAIGVQLDAVGKWVGAPRYIIVPLTNVYFSFDVAGVGFDQGQWFSSFSPTGFAMELNDTDYRTLIRVTIAYNHWDGTMPGVQSIANVFYPPGSPTTLTVMDNQNMTITVNTFGFAETVIQKSLIGDGYIVPRPLGVSITYNLV